MDVKCRYEIRPAYRNEWDDAMALAWKTFMQFEAKDYPVEGIESFKNFITDQLLYKMFVMGSYQLFCAFDDNKMVGMISLRNETHISLLFVDSKYHRRGIGRALMEYLANYLVTEMGKDFMTVNAAPYGIEFYHACGFFDIGPIEYSDGISTVPMKMQLRI